MFRTVLLFLFVTVLAIGGGAASVWYALGATGGLGSVTVAGWTAYPDAGTPTADPYSKARVARAAALPLGRAEGVAFVAARDSDGARLRRECSYLIEGPFPPARFWTLHAADPERVPLPPTPPRPVGLSAYDVVRQVDGAVDITVGRDVAPGNWLSVSGSGPMRLVLTLYDTPVASGENVAAAVLPRVRKVACHG